MDWPIRSPEQRRESICLSLVAAKPRPCGDCDCDCPLLATWRELTDHLLDALLDEMALAERMEARR